MSRPNGQRFIERRPDIGIKGVCDRTARLGELYGSDLYDLLQLMFSVPLIPL